MKILVSGPVNYDYSQYIVQEIQRLGHTVFLYPMKDFYRYCSYIERKAYKLGMSSLKNRYESKWENGLLEKCAEFSPDITIFLNGMMLNVGLLQKLQNYRKIWWLWDALERGGQSKYSWIPYFDRIAVFEHNDIEKIKPYGKDVICLPLGYSSPFAETGETERDIDISFIGMPDAKRLRLLECVAETACKNNWRMYVAGEWYDTRWPWKKLKFAKRYPYLIKYIHNEIVSAQEAATIYARSKISVNINTDDHRSFNPRSFEIMAAGAMMFYDTKNLADNPFQAGEDYCEFCSCEDLLEKLHYYLEHEKARKTIAMHGQKNNEVNSLHDRVVKLLNGME